MEENHRIWLDTVNRPKKNGIIRRSHKINVRIVPVWSAGDILLDFKGDFNKYIVSKGLQKQEGIIFRHLLRLILLLDEFIDVPPSDGSQEDWKVDLTEMKESLTVCCTNIDPRSTLEILETANDLLA